MTKITERAGNTLLGMNGGCDAVFADISEYLQS